ncbi:MAG: aldose 1-epimerase family protein [Vallitaleaceae bacterium]|nr:aldose 1-epimerase family protein [Vallitaleaceae bacterium]
MSIKLENEWVEAQFKAEGAEQTSFKLKADGCEYLWQGDPKVWGRHAPVLFPIVGKVKNNEYFIDSECFKLSQHGFARDMKFQVLAQDQTSVEFKLCDSEETRTGYPYGFELSIYYQLIESSIKTTYKIQNTGDDTMYFSIGAHPGFLCPLTTSECFSDYYLEFGGGTVFNYKRLTKESLVSMEQHQLILENGILPLKEALFADGVLIFDNLASDLVMLKNTKNDKKLEMSFPGFDYFGVWTTTSDPSFICLEPWFGIADFENSTGNFKEKGGIRTLAKGEVFTCAFSVKIS